jgi:hypothetical protein
MSFSRKAKISLPGLPGSGLVDNLIILEGEGKTCVSRWSDKVEAVVSSRDPGGMYAGRNGGIVLVD